MPAGWDQATSIPALQMVCEIGECILPVFVLRRRHRFVIKVNNPFILGVCIAEIGRGELEHLEGALRIGTYFAVGYSIQIICRPSTSKALDTIARSRRFGSSSL